MLFTIIDWSVLVTDSLHHVDKHTLPVRTAARHITQTERINSKLPLLSLELSSRKSPSRFSHRLRMHTKYNFCPIILLQVYLLRPGIDQPIVKALHLNPPIDSTKTTNELRKSSIKSRQLSTPMDSRMRESLIPSLARCSSGTEACVISDGLSAKDSTAPRDSAKAKTRSYRLKKYISYVSHTFPIPQEFFSIDLRVSKIRPPLFVHLCNRT
jgi:hypothetical protein